MSQDARPRSRRVPWRRAGGVGLLLLVAAAAWFRFGGARPLNVLLITLDTTRADHLGCYGSPAAETPVMDAAAKAGVLFERAYATAPLTLPSHASLFTGLYSPEHGVITNGRSRYVAPNLTLAELLAQANYDTAGFVASYVLNAKFGLNRGFRFYDDAIRDSSHADDLLHRERHGAAVVNAALGWLQRPRSQPFFCWVHLYDPHAPYQAHPEEFAARFQDRPYDAELAYVDRQIGRLLQYLEQTKLDARTLVVIVGDHGEGLGEHVEENHGYTLYNSTQHVPLIVKCPGKIAAGRRIPEPVSLVDVLPTICELLGRRPPGAISGRSQLAALAGKPIDSTACYAATDDPFLQEGWSPQRSLTTARWKYIRTTKPELFDLQSDPGETRNLAQSEPERLAEMEQALAQLEKHMTVQAAEGVHLSERERKVLQGLGYLGGQAAPAAGTDDAIPLLDVKDMLQHEVDSRRAADLMHAGNLPAAVVELKRIVAQAPGHAASRVLLGEALELSSDVPGAIASFEQALTIKPDHLDALIRLGAAHGSQGRLSEAVRYLDEALQVNPESIQARLNLGRALFYQEKFAEAAEHLEFALALDPDLPGARVTLGEALVRGGRKEDGIACLHQELERDPGSVPTRMQLAAACSAEDPQRALEYLAEAAELNPGNPHVQFQMGEVLLAQGKVGEAIARFQETRRLMPDHPAAAAALERARNLLER